KPPRGFAIAGTVIGAVMSLVLVLGLLSVTMFWDFFTQGFVLAATHPEVEQFYASQGRLPDAAEYDQLAQQAAQQLPGFMRPTTLSVQYAVLNERTYETALAGWDGQFGTPDDIRQTFTVTAPFQYT